MLWGPTIVGSNGVLPCVVRDLSLKIENENQDTVALLEKCADVDKRGTRLPEAKRCSVESTEVRKWQRCMDEIKKWDDSRLPLVGGDIRETVATTV
jgi:hypothetical protein